MNFYPTGTEPKSFFQLSSFYTLALSRAMKGRFRWKSAGLPSYLPGRGTCVRFLVAGLLLKSRFMRDCTNIFAFHWICTVGRILKGEKEKRAGLFRWCRGCIDQCLIFFPFDRESLLNNCQYAFRRLLYSIRKVHNLSNFFCTKLSADGVHSLPYNNKNRYSFEWQGLQIVRTSLTNAPKNTISLKIFTLPQ